MLRNVLRLLQSEIKDEYSRENFLKIQDYLARDAFRNFRFFKIVFPAGFSYPLVKTVGHGLGFIPRDIVVLSIVKDDGATITWYPDEFTRETIKLQASAACTVRALIGKYEDGE